MQTRIALTFLSVVAEEQFSLDELVLCVRQIMEQKGVPGMLRLILELRDGWRHASTTGKRFHSETLARLASARLTGS